MKIKNQRNVYSENLLKLPNCSVYTYYLRTIYNFLRGGGAEENNYKTFMCIHVVSCKIIKIKRIFSILPCFITLLFLKQPQPLDPPMI